MLPVPKQPSRPSGLYEWARQTTEWMRQRGAAGAGGAMTTKGFIPNRPPQSFPAAAGQVEQFRVEAVYKNHLLCKRVTLSDAGVRTVANDVTPLVPHTDTALVRIAKPDELRVAGWDAAERDVAGLPATVDGYEYVYESNGMHPDQVRRPWNERTTTLVDGAAYAAAEVVFTDEAIWPAYVERHSIIYAAKVKGAKMFGVTEMVVGGDPPTVDYEVNWVDLNVAGRTWQPKLRKTRVCVNGQTGTWYVLIRASDAFQEV